MRTKPVIMILVLGLAAMALGLGPTPKAQALVMQAQCVDLANDFVANMVRPSSGDPNAMDKCSSLLSHCLGICTCGNSVDRTACQLVCHSSYDYPTHCP